MNKQLNFFFCYFCFIILFMDWNERFCEPENTDTNACFSFVSVRDHRLLHPKGLAQLRLDNWVSLMLIGWCANMRTISTVINSLNLFKQHCASFLNVSSFLCSHFLKKWCPGPPRINVKYNPVISL